MANKMNNKAVDPIDAIIDQIGITPASFVSSKLSSKPSNRLSNTDSERADKLKEAKQEKKVERLDKIEDLEKPEEVKKTTQASIRSIGKKNDKKINKEEPDGEVDPQANQTISDVPAVKKKSSKKKKALSPSEYIKDYRKGKKNVLISEILYKELLYHNSGITVSKSINRILAEYLMETYPSCSRKMEKFLKNL